MKKLLLSACALAVSTLSFGQISYDLEASLISPTNGASITGGTQFSIQFEVTNNGPDAIPVGDTIDVVPSFAGYYFITQGNQLVGWRFVLTQPLGMGQSLNETRPLNFNGPIDSLTQVVDDFCVEIYRVMGVASGGELDSSNWFGCSSNISYTSTLSTGKLSIVEQKDMSYYSSGIMFVNMEGLLTSSNVSLDLINLAGQTVFNESVRVNNGNARKEVQLPSLPAGVYIVRLNDGQGFHSTKKIMIQN